MKKVFALIAAALVTFGACWLWAFGHDALAVLAIFVALVFSTIGHEKEGRSDA